ncbi:MAG: MFS transporter [Pseudomonadota bacterium]
MLSFLKENYRWIGGGFLLTYFSSFGQTFFIASSVAEWQAQFGLSHGGFGALYFMATLGSALLLPFVGRLVDIIPEHKVIAVVVPILALASLMAAFASSLIMLTLAIFLLRLFGQGMMTHIALTATGRWFAAQRGRAVSLVVMGHQGGEATLPLAFVAVGMAFGWQAGWIAGSIAMLLVALPLGVWAYRVPRLPKGQSEKTATKVREWTRNEVLKDPIFWLILTGTLAPPFIGTTIFFHQDYLTTLREWPPQLFAQGLSVMAITTVTCALLNGAIIDRYGAKSVLPFFLLPLSAACFAVAFSDSAPTLFFFMFLLGISYGISATLFGALWPEIYGTKHLGAIRSVIVSAMVLATAIGPGITGALIDYGIDLPSQLFALGGYCLLTALSMATASLILRRRARKEAAGLEAIL